MKFTEFFFRTFMENCRTLMKINSLTMKINIYKFENVISDDPDEEIDGICLISDYMKSGKIFEEDLWQFERLLHIKELAQRSLDDQNTIILSYRIHRSHELIWMRLELMVPENYSTEQPYVLLFNYDLNRNEKEFFEACYTLSGQIYKIIKADLTRNNFAMIKELPSENQQSLYFLRGILSSGDTYGRDVYIHPDDLKDFRKHMDRNFLIDYFRRGSPSLIFHYRRKIGSLYRWVKLIMIPATEYNDENMIFFIYIQDVHKEVLHVLDITAGLDFTRQYSGETNKICTDYYDNLLNILSSCIQKYIDFSMIDLQKDLVIRYKMKGSFLRGNKPYVCCCSEFIDSLKPICSDSSAEKLERIDDVEKIRALFSDKMTQHLELTSKSGREYRIEMRKTEAHNGIANKILCMTTLKENEAALKIHCFGNFEVLDNQGNKIDFKRNQSKEVLAYLIDRHGFPVTTKDIAVDVLEQAPDNINALKYASALIRGAVKDLSEAGYYDIIVKSNKTIRINIDLINCDYYHLMDGDVTQWHQYHNEYMKEYSWAEETNAEIMKLAST